MAARKRKKSKSIIKPILLILNALAVLLLLFSYLAPYIDPKFFWPFAFFGLAYPILLFINLCFFIYWLLHKSIVCLLSFIPLILGYVPLKKHIGFSNNPNRQEVDQRDSTFLRVLTYNVHLFRQEDSNTTPKTKEEITELIRSVKPDIVCLQEFYTRKHGKYNTKQHLAPQLGLPYSYFKPIYENDYEAYGLIILSRYPIQQAGSIPDYRERKTLNRVIYADIFRNGRAFRVYNIHLQSIGFEPQDYAFVRDVQKHAFEKDNVASTRRIGSRLKWAFIERSEQARHVKDEINKCKKPVILMGDFNDTPLSYAVNTIATDLKNSFVEKGSGWGVTYNGEFPNFQIDYILSSKTFEIQHYQILKKKLSDHYAIWSDLKL